MVKLGARVGVTAIAIAIAEPPGLAFSFDLSPDLGALNKCFTLMTILLYILCMHRDSHSNRLRHSHRQKQSAGSHGVYAMSVSMSMSMALMAMAITIAMMRIWPSSIMTTMAWMRAR